MNIKTIAFCGAICFLSTSALAAPPSVEKRVAHLSIDLELTPEQEKLVLEIMRNHDTQRKAIHDKYKVPTPENLRSEMRDLRKELKTQMAQVLSEEQKQRFDDLPRHKPKKRRHRNNSEPAC